MKLEKVAMQRNSTDIQVLSGDVHHFAAGPMQPLINDGVCPFTVERQLPLWTANCKQTENTTD